MRGGSLNLLVSPPLRSAGPLSESQGQNLALTVLYVPSLIGSGMRVFLGFVVLRCVRVRDSLPNCVLGVAPASTPPNPLLFKGMVFDIASPWH